MKMISRAVITAACLLTLVGCSSKPPATPTAETKAPEKVEKKEPVAYTGKSCFQRMTDQAQRWSADALPFHFESKLNSESNGHDGKATIWTGMFGSASKRTYKTFTCSGSRLPDSPPVGVTSSAEFAYAPSVQASMFPPSYLVVDSDAAYKTADEKGGKKVMEKDPNQPVMYALDWNVQQKQLEWVVIYGTSPKESKGIGIIDASTGKFVRGK